MSRALVAPSLLAADPMRFAEETASVESAGADWHHVDVMDGHFVPNLTYGLPFIEALKKRASIPLDVHIMISNPDSAGLDYVRAGADLLVFHVEASRHPHRLIQAVKSAGAKAGIALNPGTPVEAVEPLLPEVDLVLVMSVNPGYGGQKYIQATANRVRRLRDMLDGIHRINEVLIQVDGGINAETGRSVFDAGARVLVAGTYVYGAKDRRVAIDSLKFTK